MQGLAEHFVGSREDVVGFKRRDTHVKREKGKEERLSKILESAGSCFCTRKNFQELPEA